MAARLARSQILYDGCYAHVISRSIGKRKVFNDPEDFRVFRELLIKIRQVHDFKIYHYCFMNTHFHLVVKIPEVFQFSRGLQKLKSQYIYKFHTKYKISGPIWRERFRSLLIENESYLYACGQYIENNPVKAGIVRTSVEWEYSSSRYYLRGGKDGVVDGYETAELPKLPEGADVADEEMFEKGIAIGSGYFRYQMREMLKNG